MAIEGKNLFVRLRKDCKEFVSIINKDKELLRGLLKHVGGFMGFAEDQFHVKDIDLRIKEGLCNLEDFLMADRAWVSFNESGKCVLNVAFMPLFGYDKLMVCEFDGSCVDFRGFKKDLSEEYTVTGYSKDEEGVFVSITPEAKLRIL